ncbi:MULTISPECIES: hypothetical protein [unclassified Okeania]|uniref:hypothetical protein n=1 Tax=unclassified Okeania TaxID=2634635 RepID=UPI0013B5C26D|nr:MULTISPECIES: hypothetical protein [unclassified Okeania]NET18049.1 hypothetical protein [Okeania sp. SIO1H5]NET76339.1 hypothetical protein [Okeania sp. SIO1F9]NET92420.1 hypothetical protein [Okeania sp. SIO1H2]
MSFKLLKGRGKKEEGRRNKETSSIEGRRKKEEGNIFHCLSFTAYFILVRYTSHGQDIRTTKTLPFLSVLHLPAVS